MSTGERGSGPRSPGETPSSPFGPESPASVRTRDRRTTRERRALEMAALLALGAIGWLTMPVAAGLLLGTMMAFTLQPFYEALHRRTGRPVLASLTTVVGSALAIVAMVAVFGSLFVTRGVALTSKLFVALGPEGSLQGTVRSVTGFLDRLGLSVEDVTAKLRDAAAEIAGKSAAFAEGAAAATASGFLGLLFALLMMHLILRNWSTIVERAETLSPLRPQYTRALLEEFQRVGRATLLGTIVTGLAQGLFATIGYWMTDAPDPAFFGIATALASLVPGIGTLLVWVPIGIFLVLGGHVARGIIELVWGAAVVSGVSDYVIRPRLVGDEAIPTLVTFIALFGGVEVFGLKGLVVGPVVMSVAIATLRLYARESNTTVPTVHG